MFPEGKWIPWDPRIPVEGQFIESWLNDDVSVDSGDVSLDNPVVFLERAFQFVWDMFNTHVALFHRLLLISSV